MKSAFVLAAALGLFGCMAVDPGEGAVADGTGIEQEALSGRCPAARQETTLLVSLADGTIRRFSATGKDLGVFADLASPFLSAMAADDAGNIYVAEADAGVRRLSASGKDLGFFATVSDPFGLAFDAAGNLYVSAGSDNTVSKLSPSGQLLGIAISLLGVGCPAGLAVNGAGTLFVADLCASMVREFTPSGQSVELTAGIGHPIALGFDHAGNLLVANSDNGGEFSNTIRQFAASGEDLGVFTTEGLHFPSALAFLPDGRLLVANEEQRPGAIDYSIRAFTRDGEDLGDFAVLPAQPQALLVLPAHRYGH